jgi:biopolymer transport protein ExbD
MPSTRPLLVCTALLTIAFGAAACDSQDQRAPSAPAAQTAAAAEGLKLRIKPGGQYFVAGESSALTAEQLAARLKREDPSRFGRAVYVLSDPGIVGYDVVLAMNAAQDAGFTHAEGLANYRERATNGTRPEPWEMDLSRQTRTVAADTARRK